MNFRVLENEIEKISKHFKLISSNDPNTIEEKIKNE